MQRLMARAVIWGVVVVAMSGTVGRAAGWADALFAEKGHDFGPVPRGEGPAPVRADESAGRAGLDRRRPRLVRMHRRPGRAPRSVAPGGSAIVEAEMDTRNFTARKVTTLIVDVRTASGRQAEVRLGVSSTILSDIVLNPGTIDFGAVARGQARPLVLTIDRTGLATWRVLKMVSASRVIDASLQETARTPNLVSYTLSVSLKPDAPAGPVRDEIRLITNDPETPNIPILVTARIQGDLSASPSVLAMGNVASSGGVQGRFLVRASRPFRILRVDGEGDGFKVAAADPATQAHARPDGLLPPRRGELPGRPQAHLPRPDRPAGRTPPGADRDPARRSLTRRRRAGSQGPGAGESQVDVALMVFGSPGYVGRGR